MRTLLSFAFSSGRHCLCFEGQFHSLALIFCCINYLSTIVDTLKLKFVRKRIGFVNNLTIKHCVKAKVKTIMVKTLKTVKTLKSADISTFTQRHFQVKMNKKMLLEYKCTKQILRDLNKTIFAQYSRCCLLSS